MTLRVLQFFGDRADLMSGELSDDVLRVRNPDVLPEGFGRFSIVMRSKKTPEGIFASIDVPAELRNAVPKRRLHFLAGRYCAARALEELTGVASHASLGRKPSGETRWPEAIVGSITHVENFASAAVGLGQDFKGVGIDSEAIMSEAQVQRVSRTVLGEAERSPAQEFADLRIWTTFVFSAKESLFKCLYPLIGERFYHADACVCDVEFRARSFRVRLERDLSSTFGAGQVIPGRFEIGEPYLHTAVWLPRGAAGS